MINPARRFVAFFLQVCRLPPVGASKVGKMLFAYILQWGMVIDLSIGVLIVSELLKLLTNKFSRNGGKR